MKDVKVYVFGHGYSNELRMEITVNDRAPLWGYVELERFPAYAGGWSAMEVV